MRTPSRPGKAAAAAIVILGVAGLILLVLLIARKPPAAPVTGRDEPEQQAQNEPAGQPEPEPEPETKPEPEADQTKTNAVPASLESDEAGRPLGVGDPAPLLEVDWVRGDPSEPGDGGPAHIVEFWATWCGPCIHAMPHLSELQSHYAESDLRVVGVSIDREPTRVVRTFLDEHPEIITYAVAHDTRQRVSRSWMDAAGQQGIPASFIVGRDGRIAWIGHPMSPEFDSIVERVVAGEYDVNAQIRERQDEAFRLEQAKELETEMSRLWSEGETEKAVGMIDQLIELAPSEYSGLAVRKAEIYAYETPDYDKCAQFASSMAHEYFEDDSQTLYSLAVITTSIAGDDAGRKAKARELSDMALKATGETNPLALIDYARLLNSLGEREDALNALTEARIYADDERLIQMIDITEAEIGGL